MVWFVNILGGHWYLSLILAVAEINRCHLQPIELMPQIRDIIQQNSNANAIRPFLLSFRQGGCSKFALLIKMNSNFNQSKSLMNDIMKKICASISNVSIICIIGIGKMHVDPQYCNWIEWKHRVFGYVDKVDHEWELARSKEPKIDIYCDTDHELVNENDKNFNIGDSDDKKENNSINTNAKRNRSHPADHVTATLKTHSSTSSIASKTVETHAHFDEKNVIHMRTLVNQTLVDGKIIDTTSSQCLYPSWKQRCDIAKNMIETAKRRDCETQEIKESRKEALKTGDKLCQASKKYIAVDNWFVKTYSYLSLLKQKIDDLLSHLVSYFEQYYQCNSIKIYQFDILYYIYQYLDHVGDLLILFYTCYNWDFVSIFYPFITQAIGKKQCDLLFCNNEYKHSNNNNYSYNDNNSSMSTIVVQATQLILRGNDSLSTEQYQTLLKVYRSVYLVKELFSSVDGMTTIKPAWLPPDIDNSKYKLTLSDLYNYTCSKLKESVNEVVLRERKMFYYNDDINIQPIRLDTKSMVPNFVRLFVLNRILVFKPGIVENMLTQVNKTITNKKHQMIICSIINFLYKNGIKSFMNEYYNEIEQSLIIDIIFDKIILKLFDFAFQKKIIYYSSNESKHISNVFNTTDLICLIFQFVYQTFNDCQNTSLVCSYWMYYSFDTKSHNLHYNNNNVPYNGDSTLPTIQMQIKQFYQCNAKSLKIDLKYYMLLDLNQNILSHVEMFKNIEIIDIKCMGHHLKVIELIVKNCGNNIKSFKSDVFDGPIKLPILKLPNVKSIEMNNLCLPIIFSNKCEKLTIKSIPNLSHKWFKFLFENCDCTNLKEIKLEQVTFDTKYTSDKIMKNYLVKVAKKLINLQSLDISLRRLTIDAYYEKSDQDMYKKCHLEKIEQLKKSEHLWDIFVSGLQLIIPNGNSNSKPSDKNDIVLSLNYHNYSTDKTNEMNNDTIYQNRGRAGNRRVYKKIVKDLVENSFAHYKVYPLTRQAKVRTRTSARTECFTVDMYGANCSPYRGQVLKLEVSLNLYPTQPPNFQFKSKIHHANVNKAGRVMWGMDNNWDKERKSLNECLDDVFELLKNPDEIGLPGLDRAELYLLNRKKYYKWAGDSEIKLIDL